MTISVWVWLRGEFLLESFLPLDFSSSATRRDEESPRQSTAIDGAHAIVDECQSKSWDRLSVTEWSVVVEEIGLDNALSEAVFQNASGNETYASLSSLALHMLLVGLEYFTYDADESINTRGDVITTMVHEQMDDFIGVLWRCATGCSRAALKNDHFHFTDEQLKKFFASLDLLLEGMTEDDDDGEGHDEIVEASYVIKKLWLKNEKISLQRLTTNLRRCLVQDPFHIDDLSVDTPSCSPRRVTSLTNTRRKVTVTGWQRFQLLSKAVYKDVHLRISSNKSESMFFAPYRCRSVIVDNVKSCPAMVLGPTHGAVILREVHHSNITVACKQLYLWNCTRVNVFLHSFRPPVVRGCAGVNFAAFNVSYELDDSEVSTLALSDFYIQPVPVVNNDSDVKQLLQKLPPVYRVQWESSMAKMMSSPSGNSSSLPLKKSDLIYLRGKIVGDK